MLTVTVLYGAEHIFSRQIRALGRKGDVVLAISTSGRPPNITEGLRAATELGLTTVLLTSQKSLSWTSSQTW